ncbi:MAG: nitronate monooxygenase [Lacisediminihabitans sp.]
MMQESVLRTPLCDVLGIELPIWSAGMGGGASGFELVAAVSGAGGLGVLGTAGLPEEVVREEIRQIKAATDKPFGINLLIPALAPGEDLLQLAIDEKVPVVVLFWGDPTPFVERAHASGITVVVQVGSVDEARSAASAGADAIIFQGMEAGGHVRGITALSVGLPATVRAVAPLPVVASGGIADGAGLVAALALGAQGISIGTRFLCSPESRVWGPYKDRIVAAQADETILTGLFDVDWPGAPHRVLRNAGITEWEDAGRPESGSRPGEGTVVARMPVAGQVIEVPRYHFTMPLEGLDGDMELMCLHAGESCSLIESIEPAADIVATIAADARALLVRAD